MDLKTLKENYNKVLEREKNAEKFLDAATQEQFKKWFPEFNKIIKELSGMMKEFEKITGRKMTRYEVLNGFWMD